MSAVVRKSSGDDRCRWRVNSLPKMLSILDEDQIARLGRG